VVRERETLRYTDGLRRRPVGVSPPLLEMRLMTLLILAALVLFCLALVGMIAFLVDHVRA
jgi:hypothetical protein